jgi:HSP20 family protein
MSNLSPLNQNRWANPFQELSRMQNDFERLFQDFKPAANLAANLIKRDEKFVPSCELTEDKTNYFVQLDMPGMKKDQVKVELENNVLTVSAERTEEKKTEHKKTQYTEIAYGSYMRSFSLPSQVVESKIDAKFESGVLTITLPKAEQSKSKSIAVQ